MHANPGPLPDRRQATVHTLIAALGGGLVDVLAAPQGLDMPAGDPVVFDRVGTLAPAPGDLLLAVGIHPDSPDALDVVDAARRAKAAAVIVKVEDEVPGGLVRAAAAAGVALLAVPATTGWGHLLTLLRTANTASRVSDTASAEELAIGDLFGLANAVAAMVGGAVTIEDLDSNVLAYSTLEQAIDQPRRDTILGRKVPDSWMRALVDDGVFKTLYADSQVVRIDDIPGAEAALMPRLAIAVRAGDEPLGSIWVVEGEQPLAAAAEKALQGAAQIAALHMLQHRAHADLERQQRSGMLRALLDGGVLEPGGGRLGITPGGSFTVLAFAPVLDNEPMAEVKLERMVGLITLYTEVYRRNAHTVAIDDVVYVLLPTSNGVTTTRLRALADDLRKRTEATAGVPIRVGIGSTVTEPRDIHRSRTEADQVLRVIARRDEPVGYVDDVRGHIALQRLEDLIAAEPLLRAGRVERLVAHDQRRGSNHVETLRAFLDAFGDVVAAAASLNVHPNTFRYRLGRLVELSEIDLDDPDERLITHLQLRFLRAADNPPAAETTRQKPRRRNKRLPLDFGTGDQPADQSAI